MTFELSLKIEQDFDPHVVIESRMSQLYVFSYFIHATILIRNERCKRHFAGYRECCRGGSVKYSALKSQGERENDETRKKVMGNMWDENAKDGGTTSLGAIQETGKQFLSAWTLEIVRNVATCLSAVSGSCWLISALLIRTKIYLRIKTQRCVI